MVPEALTRGLRGAFGAVPSVPPGFDERILAAARFRLARRSSHRLLALRLSAGAGIAAAVALSTVIWFAPVSSSALPVASADDINRDGRIDVLDAMALALAHGTKNPIDDPDVHSLMARIVSLSPPQPVGGNG